MLVNPSIHVGTRFQQGEVVLPSARPGNPRPADLRAIRLVIDELPGIATSPGSTAGFVGIMEPVRERGIAHAVADPSDCRQRLQCAGYGRSTAR